MQHFFLHRRWDASTHVAWVNGLSQVDVIFTFADNYTRSFELRLCRVLPCTYLYISQYVVTKQSTPLQQKQYAFHGNIPPKRRKFITLANCSSSVFPIVLVKSPRYTRIILCCESTGENSKIKPAFTKYGAKHTQGCWIRILLPSMSEMLACKQLQRNKF